MGDESAESNEGVEAAEGNGAAWRKFADPRLPNAEEQRVHFLTHVPYRSWCSHCVRGKGKKVLHARNAKDEDRQINEVHLAYCFMSSGGDDTSLLTILVAKERDAGMTCSTVVPRNGGDRRIRGKADISIHTGNKVRVCDSDSEVRPSTCDSSSDIRCEEDEGRSENNS